MSSTSHPTISSLAPWYPLFSTHLSHLGPSPEFSLATVSPSSDGGLPHVRTCIHRGFFCSLPPNKYNTLPKNPAVFSTECPTFTTDARMEKTYDIFATGRGKGTREQSKSGSGGGGPVEACYWIPKTEDGKSVMCQWRVRGKCWVLSVEDIDDQNSGAVSVKAELGRYMRGKTADADNSSAQATGDAATSSKSSKVWSWPLEIQNHFGNLSPLMKGSFKNPPPGEPVSHGARDRERLGQKAGELMDEGEEVARRNFRVAVITPEEVECVDLSDPEKARRWRWTLSKESGGPDGLGNEEGVGKPVGEWNMVELWP